LSSQTTPINRQPCYYTLRHRHRQLH
jgi:hypothetical protein